MPATGRWPVPLLPPGRWHVWGEGTSTSFTFTGEKIEVALKSGPGAKGRK